MIITSYPRETVEYVKFDHVTVNGQATTTFKYAIAGVEERPPVADDTDGWLATVTVDDKPGFLLAGLTPGAYKVWVKVDAGSAPEAEHVVIEAGEISVD